MTEEEAALMQEARKRASRIRKTKTSQLIYVRGLTPEEEAFCVEFSSSMDRKKALEAAGYTGNNPTNMAARWLAKQRIQDRLAELRNKVEARAELNRETYLQMLQATYDKAMSDGDYSGANKASELLGRAMGYFVEQKAVLNVSAKMPEDKAQRVAEVQRLAKIAGVSLE